MTMFPIQTTQYRGNLSKLVGAILPIQITKFCGNFSKVAENPPSPPTPTSSFVRKLDGILECDVTVEIWRIDLMKACHITHFLVIHRRSQMLLTFNRHQMVYNISCVLPCAEVTGKGYFVIQQQSKEQS